MPEKTVNAYQRFILLRSFLFMGGGFMKRIFPLLCAVSFIISSFVSFAPTVSAAEVVDYNEFITNIVVDGENDVVTVSLPVSYTGFSLIENGVQVFAITSDKVTLSNLNPGSSYNLIVHPYPHLISMADIPDGTVISATFTGSEGAGYNNPYVVGHMAYYTTEGSWVWTDDIVLGRQPFFHGDITYSLTLHKPSDGGAFHLFLDFADFSPLSSSSSWTVQCTSMQFVMSINSLLRLQQTTGKTNQILSAVEDKLADQGKTLDDVLKEQQDTNDKLDELPGQIGDEMQGVIENEKEESKSEGNKFVDQILDALPDPSTEVLAALKGLTDATSYTGTDAILPIPAIVLPGIDGLFPETVIWGGTNFDFGEYISFLPASLLTLVQSLFTIAIVLFCVYEFKGIISYCLTLRESKGG